MSASIKATLGKDNYYTEVVAGNNQLVSDEPIDKGGQDKGFKPTELLASSLACCTAATLKMYLDRKEWNVDKIHIEVELSDQDASKTTVFSRKISFEGANFTAEQMKRIQHIADACPVHKILTGNVKIPTEFV
ncbi:MAG: osmotically inducible protein OsmC [Pseudopedobacter saltans]|uniref:Osmotically inducible protein OsmC n=1 Tax=Pseudopedobacter saltans TaxID=151895 RepID=A0A2W5GDV8_9SPHI|nr:MAG: osmotically inducible protein OsmC [Pseudopedobacter saltans]